MPLYDIQKAEWLVDYSLPSRYVWQGGARGGRQRGIGRIFLYSLKWIQEFTLIDSFLGKQVKLVLFNGAYEQCYCE